jgi:HNH endonuclease
MVHHINGDRGDNRPKNLRVLLSQGHHMALKQLQWKVERWIEPLFGFEELLK